METEKKKKKKKKIDSSQSILEAEFSIMSRISWVSLIGTS